MKVGHMDSLERTFVPSGFLCYLCCPVQFNSLATSPLKPGCSSWTTGIVLSVSQVDDAADRLVHGDQLFSHPERHGPMPWA